MCGRLLYVDPMMRMTVQELAAHPWLDRTCCAHNKTPLSSPIMLANRVSLCPQSVLFYVCTQLCHHAGQQGESVSVGLRVYHVSVCKCLCACFTWMPVRVFV